MVLIPPWKGLTTIFRRSQVHLAQSPAVDPHLKAIRRCRNPPVKRG